MQFLKYTLATLLGLVLFTFLSFLILGGILSAISSKESTVTIEQGSILKLNLDTRIRERAKENPFEGLDVPGLDRDESLGLIEIKRAIKNAKTDDNIKGIYIEVTSPQAGYAVLQEIRDALVDFKTSKKFVYAYSEVYSEGAYYVASAADKVMLNPAGVLEFNGLSSEKMYFRNTFDKLGIKPEIFKVGEFKSAVEPFFRESMSAEDQQQTASYLNSIYNFYLKNVSATRGISVEELRNISSKMLVQNAADAMQYKLVTDTAYYDQVETALRAGAGLKEDAKLKDYFVAVNKYLKTEKTPDKLSENRIAVIVAEGNIVSGEDTDDQIGGNKIAEEIRKAREDKKVKAIVLRINSPGGSALASDVMWREVELTTRVKPVIASMSSLAASGGYYMAMACDTIVAQPNTITGSIGIFGTLFDAQGFFNEKLGVTFDRVSTGEFSALGMPTKHFTDAERQHIQKGVEEGYARFTGKAAQGRGMSIEALKKVASGRVWTGEEAQKVGLVDILGGFDDAVRIAADAAGLKDDYRVKYYPEQKNFLSKLLSDTETQMRENALREELGPMYPYFQQFRTLQQLQGIQARLPYDIIIQ